MDGAWELCGSLGVERGCVAWVGNVDGKRGWVMLVGKVGGKRGRDGEAELAKKLGGTERVNHVGEVR